MRQLLTERVMLSVLGGALGVFFGVVSTRIIVLVIPPDYVPNEVRITISGYVLLFSVAVSALTGILFGLVVSSSGPSRADERREY